MENREKYYLPEFLSVPKQFQEMPDIDKVDPELMFDLFSRAKELCEEKQIEFDAFNLLRSAKTVAVVDYKKEFMSHGNEMNQLHLSIINPGLEVMRYLPRIAQRLGMDVEREFKPLWEYIEPDFMTRLNFGHWNKISHILDDLPNLAQQLKDMDDKPMFFLVNRITDHGTVANIVSDEFAISLKANLDKHDEPNALHFSENLGPKVLEVTDKWIIEEYFRHPYIEEYDRYDTNQPFLYGNLFGAALRQIHNQGYSYNLIPFENILVNPEDNSLHIKNFCNARKDGNTTADLQNARNILHERYLDDIGKAHPEVTIRSFGTQPYILAYRGFLKGYETGEHLPLSSSNRSI